MRMLLICTCQTEHLSGECSAVDAGKKLEQSSKAGLASAAVQELIVQLLPAALQPLSAILVQTPEQQQSNARFEAYKGEEWGPFFPFYSREHAPCQCLPRMSQHFCICNMPSWRQLMLCWAACLNILEACIVL
jgi:hypothetical protein